MAAKKDKQARRLARKRKEQQPEEKQPKEKQRTQPSGEKVLRKRIRASKNFKDNKVIQNTGGAENMSDVIRHFAEPLQDEDGVVPQNILRFAILVWNASLLSEERQEKTMEDIFKSLPNNDEKMKQRALLAMTVLLERKEKHFSDNKRFIIDYHITETAHRINLDVVSTAPDGYNPEL